MIDKIQFRPGHLTDPIAERAAEQTNIGASFTVGRDIDRYYQLLALALASITLSEGEAMLIVDATNGTLFEPFSVAAQSLHWEIQDSLADGLAAKWEVDGPALVAKISAWSLLQKAAVCDAIERFWGDTYHIDNSHARLARVGLIKAAH